MNQIVILTFQTDSNRPVRSLGCYQISFFMRENGYTTQVLDFLYYMSKEQRINLYNKFISIDTKVIAFAPFMMPSGMIVGGSQVELGIQPAIDILNEVREYFPWAKIVVAGHISGWFLRSGFRFTPKKVDAVFVEEGEHSFLEYCNHVFKKTSHPPFTLRSDLKVIHPTKKYDISTCGMRYEKQDFVLPNESLPFEFSRGCIFKCRFCQYPNIGKDKNDFNKPMSLIRDSLIYNYETFGTTRYHWTDDTFNSHRLRTQEFCEMTKTLPFKIEYICFVRLDLLDIWPEQKDILVESGLVSAQFGIESLDPESCKQIGKGWGANNHKSGLEKISNHWGDDVIINCSLIAGLGKETPMQWEESYQWFTESKIHDFFFQPLWIHATMRMSEFERNASDYGYHWHDPDKNPWAWNNEVTTFDEAMKWCQTKRGPIQFKRRVPSVWNFAGLRNLGFTKSEILESNYWDIHLVRRKEKRHDNLILEYYNLAMSY